jgi:DNA repair protein RecO (recombination protein O)
VASYVTEAIVTGARRYGEADRLLVLFTRKRGRLSAIAKSARKPKSTIRGASEPFVRAKFELAEGKTLDIVRQVEIIDPHLGIRSSWTRLQLAGHVAEIANKMSEERMPDEFLYDLISDTLSRISDGHADASVRFKAFLLEHMGVFPSLSGCAKCGCEKVRGDVHLALAHHGFLCSDCAKESQVWHPIPMKVLHVLHDYRNGSEYGGTGDDDPELLGSAEDVLTTLLEIFLQQGFKTSGAAKHARKFSRDRDNIKVELDAESVQDQESEPAES